MTQIDFHLLTTTQDRDRWVYSCKLTEKIYRLGLRALLRVASESEAKTLDDLLWTFRQGSFIPHGTGSVENAFANEVPVWISQDFAIDLTCEVVLINLSQSFPPDPSRYSRIVEVLDDQPDRKQAGRERFAHYRRLGHGVKAHDIDLNSG